MPNNTKTIEVYGHSKKAWDDAQPEIDALISAGYKKTNIVSKGMTTLMHFHLFSQDELEAAVERGADDFENTYLEAVRLTAHHYGIPEDKADSMISIGRKIHKQREADKAMTPADDSGEPEWVSRSKIKLNKLKSKGVETS